MKPHTPVLSFGVDPDTSRFAMAAVTRTPLGALELWRIFHFGWVKTEESPIGELPRLFRLLEIMMNENRPAGYHNIITVESQEIYLGGKAAPKNIVALAQMAGAQALFALRGLNMTRDAFYMPSPKEWMGQVPKEIKQARSFVKLGIPFRPMSGYVVPTVPAHLSIQPPSEWKHMGDAVGLALWGIEKFDREQSAKRAAGSP